MNDALTNNCQHWNNGLIDIFKTKRRTLWSWVTAMSVGIVAGLTAFWFSLPQLMAHQGK